MWGVGDGVYLMIFGMGLSIVWNLMGDVVDNIVLFEIVLIIF